MADGAAAGDDLDAKLAETQEEVRGVNDSWWQQQQRLLRPAFEEDQEEAQSERDFIALRNAFALFDADGDGKLTEDEVVAALTRKTGQGTELSVMEARDTWERWQAEFDLNNDGKISYDELSDAFELSDALFDMV